MQAVTKRCHRPISCASYQGPCLSVPARSFRTSTVNNNARPESSQDAASVPDDGYLNVQINPENKTVTTAVGELPLSPLMDPAFHEARQKFTKPKPQQQEHKLTKFQRQLSRSPYAHALATPVRRCTTTNTSLPTFFLQRFNLLSHPETERPWFVPHGLDSKVPSPDKTIENDLAGESQAEREPRDLAQEAPEGAQAGEQAAPPADKTQKLNKKGPSAYILSRQGLLQEFHRSGSAYFKGQMRLLRMSDRGQSRLGAVLNNATWRLDMDSVLLELMRRRVVEGLCHFAKMVQQRDREYIVKCERWTDAPTFNHRGCLLYLGPPEGTSPEAGLEYIPPRLSTMDMGKVRFGSKLAVHNLRVLLGEEHVGRLRRESELLRDGSLFLLGRQATMNLQMLMWKLQGYMAWEEEQATSGSDDPSDGQQIGDDRHRQNDRHDKARQQDVE